MQDLAWNFVDSAAQRGVLIKAASPAESLLTNYCAHTSRTHKMTAFEITLYVVAQSNPYARAKWRRRLMSCIVHAGGSVNVWNSEDRTALEFDDLREAIRARVGLLTSGFCAVFCKSRL